VDDGLDKVISPLQLGETVVHGVFAPDLWLHTEASLCAEQDACNVAVRVFHDDTPKEVLGTILGGLGGDPNHWWPVWLEGEIEHDDVGEYRVVATGTQRVAAGPLNRSTVPKPLVPIARSFEEWPGGYSVAGLDEYSQPNPVREALATAVKTAIDEYRSDEGYHYASYKGNPLAAEAHVALSMKSIVFIAAHSIPNHVALVYGGDPWREKLRGGTAGEDPPHNDLTNNIYYIEEPFYPMEHCRFALFWGCETAVPNDEGSSLTGAAVDQGVDLSAGFLEDVYPGPAAAMFHQRFWQYALGGCNGVTASVREAVRLARLDIVASFPPEERDGIESLRLYPVDADEDLRVVEWGD